MMIREPRPNQGKSQMWLAIRLTHLPLESLGVHRHHDNILVSHKGRVCAMTDNLRAKDIARGMPTSTAQLLHKVDDEVPCRTYEREIESETNTLDALCEQLYSCTPHIELQRVQVMPGCEDVGVLLELSRCIKLFRGMMPLLESISTVLRETELSYRYALGHTKHIAWLLSYTQKPTDHQHTREDFITQLKALDITYLYHFPDVAEKLKKSGFFSFGDLISHIEQTSLHSLRSRYGEAFANYLAETLAIDTAFTQASLFQKPAATYQPKKTFIESIHFDYPVNSSEQLVHPVKNLLESLTEELCKSQMQTQAICWHLYDIHHQQQRLPIRFERLHHDSQLALELTMIHLENQPLPFEVDVLELRCEKITSVNFSTTSIYIDRHHAHEQHALATVTAKLSARLGEQAVFKMSPRDSHIPELSFNKHPVDENIQRFSPAETHLPEGDRPSWIFNIPVHIGKQQNSLYWRGKLELLQGPERIEGLWWKKPTSRDYFVAKREDHVRLWVFYDLYKEAWYVHGVFS